MNNIHAKYYKPFKVIRPSMQEIKISNESEICHKRYEHTKGNSRGILKCQALSYQYVSMLCSCDANLNILSLYFDTCSLVRI